MDLNDYKERGHARLACHSTGEIVLPDGTHDVLLMDISSGGCKIRLPDVPGGGALAQDLNTEFVLTVGAASVPGALIWYMSGMFGCHFFDPVMLETLAQIMGSPFRIRLLPK